MTFTFNVLPINFLICIKKQAVSRTRYTPDRNDNRLTLTTLRQQSDNNLPSDFDLLTLKMVFIIAYGVGKW